MKHTAILQSICAHYYKERRFWYLNSHAKIDDVVADAKQQIENERPPRKVKVIFVCGATGDTLKSLMHFLTC
jgi:hypothetical protein